MTGTSEGGGRGAAALPVFRDFYLFSLKFRPKNVKSQIISNVLPPSFWAAPPVLEKFWRPWYIYNWKCLFTDEKVDEFSMTSFISPFHLELWLSLLVFPFATGLFLWTISSFPKGFKLLDLPKNVALSMSSMIGLNISNDNDKETKNSARLTIFVIFLCTANIYSHIII